MASMWVVLLCVVLCLPLNIALPVGPTVLDLTWPIQAFKNYFYHPDTSFTPNPILKVDKIRKPTRIPASESITLYHPRFSLFMRAMPTEPTLYRGKGSTFSIKDIKQRVDHSFSKQSQSEIAKSMALKSLNNKDDLEFIKKARSDLGSIYYGRMNKENMPDMPVVVKEFDLLQYGQEAFTRMEISVVREGVLGALLKHENIMKSSFALADPKDETRAYIASEHCSEGDLYEIMNDRQWNLPVDYAQCYLWQLLSGINYLHDLGISHGDIKPENIFINHENILKLGDFGTYRVLQDPYLLQNATRAELHQAFMVSSFQPSGTVHYWAPELLPWLRSPSTPSSASASDASSRIDIQKTYLKSECTAHFNPMAADIWAAAATYVEMRTALRWKPEINSKEFSVFSANPRKYLEDMNLFDPTELDLLTRMLELDPAQRITAREIFESDLISSAGKHCFL